MKINDKKLKAFLIEYGALVITGASSGIGKSLIDSMIRIVDKNFLICNLSRTKCDIFFDSENHINVPCDLQNLSEIDEKFALVDELLSRRVLKDKKVLFINNAGFGSYGFFPEPSVERNIEMLDLNVCGFTYMITKMLPHLKNNGGAIINVSSTAAFLACPYLSVYAASKSYVKSLSLSLSYELKKDNIKVLCLCPGPTSSNFFRNAGFTERPLPNSYGHTSAQVATSAWNALRKGKKIHVVGFTNNIMCLMTNFIPKTFLLRISGWILSKIRST